jgi:hypothetical protein
MDNYSAKMKLKETFLIKILFYFLVISLPAGAFMFEFKIWFFEMYGFRIALLSSLLFFILTKKIVFFRSELTKKVSVFFLLFSGYSFLSCLWSPDLIASVIETMYILVGALIYVVLLSFKSSMASFNSELSKSWMTTLVVILFISTWEILTQRHLVSNYTDALHQLGIFHRLHSVPVFTFDNLNHYSIYLCVSLIFLSSAILRNNSQFANGVLIALIFYLLNLFQSRFGLLFFWVSLIFVFFYWVKSSYRSKNNQSMVITFILSACLLVFGIFPFNETIRVHENLLNGFDETQSTKEVQTTTPTNVKKIPNSDKSPISIANKLSHEIKDSTEVNVSQSTVETNESQKSDMSDQPEKEQLSSNLIRKNLLLNGFDFFKRSNFIGVGAGGFKVKMQKGENLYDTSGIIDPHCYALEIISQYGVFVTLLFGILFFYVLKALFLSIKYNGLNQTHLFILLLLICYAIMSNANSAFLPLPLNWFLFALIMIKTDDLQFRSNEKSLQ